MKPSWWTHDCNSWGLHQQCYVFYLQFRGTVMRVYFLYDCLPFLSEQYHQCYSTNFRTFISRSCNCAKTNLASINKASPQQICDRWPGWQSGLNQWPGRTLRCLSCLGPWIASSPSWTYPHLSGLKCLLVGSLSWSRVWEYPSWISLWWWLIICHLEGNLRF